MHQVSIRRAADLPHPNLGGPCLIYHIGILPVWVTGVVNEVPRDFPLGTPWIRVTFCESQALRQCAWIVRGLRGEG